MITYGLGRVSKGEEGLAGNKINNPILFHTNPCYPVLTLIIKVNNDK